MDLAIKREQAWKPGVVAFALDERLEHASQLGYVIRRAAKKRLAKLSLECGVVLQTAGWPRLLCRDGRRRGSLSGLGKSGIGGRRSNRGRGAECPVDQFNQLFRSATGFDHAMVGARLPRLLHEAAQIGVGKH